MPAVAIENLHKSFGPVEVLKGVSLTVEAGEVVAIIGRSGSGKSTLLRCVNGLEPCQAGRIEVAGHVLDDDPARLRALRADVGIVLQSYNLFPHLTAGQNVMLAPRIAKALDRAAAEILARRALERVGLIAEFDVYPDDLSGGQRQRVAIARSLALDPKVMLFDEVAPADDPDLAGEVLAVLEQLADGSMTMLLATQEMRYARTVADVTVFMHEGRIWESGPSDALFARPRTPELQAFLRSGLH